MFKSFTTETRQARAVRAELFGSDRANRAGNSRSCAYCGKALSPKRGSRRQRFCNEAHRQAAYRTKKWQARYGHDQQFDLSRSAENGVRTNIQTVTIS